MAPANPSAAPETPPAGATGVLVLADGTVLWGVGYGASGAGVGEICFNTAMTGYQEILTDPSYAGQIITFTFPHIGNVGANPDDMERDKRAAIGCVTRELPTLPSNFRSVQTLPEWMAAQGLIGLAGIDTRALTRRIRDGGAPTGVVAHSPEGKFDLDKLLMLAQGWPGLEGMDLAKVVSATAPYEWTEGEWQLGSGFAKDVPATRHVVAYDFGVKRNILRSCFIPHPKLSLAAFTGLVLDYLIFGNGYLQAVQNSGWRLHWDSLDYHIDEAGPDKARITLELHTLSREAGWVGV